MRAVFFCGVFIACAVSAGALCSRPSQTEIFSSMMNYPADGVSGGVVTVRYAKIQSPAVEGPLGDAQVLTVTARERTGSEEKIFFKSTGMPGSAVFRSADGVVFKLNFYQSTLDADNDGFPDDAELVSEDDRAAFRSWFVRIAESQFLKRNLSWNNKERDCAGLIRYAYREALKTHDDQWQKRSGIVIDKNIPDVKRFHYPDIPKIADRIFKIKKGKADDRLSFGTFADAETLLKLNCSFVSRRLSDARMGDVLFFHLDSAESPYHSMIIAQTGNDPLLVYHTGKGDVVKRVPLSYLKGSGPFETEESNSRFIGVYRFSILE